jgi:hypothetical protein
MKNSKISKNFSVGRNFGPPVFFQKKAANEKFPNFFPEAKLLRQRFF